MLDYELAFELEDEDEFELDYSAGYDEDYEAEDYEAEYESEASLRLMLPVLAPHAIRAISQALKESELEGEAECELGSAEEFEMELEMELVDYEDVPEKLYSGASEQLLMRQLAHAAAHSQSEAEAEAYIGGLASIALQSLPKVTARLAKGSHHVNWNKVVPQAAQSVHSATPAMIKAVSRLVKKIRSHPATREVVHTMPVIMNGTVRSMARRVANGERITSRTAMHDLAANTANVLKSPRKTAKAMRSASPRTRQPLPRYR